MSDDATTSSPDDRDGPLGWSEHYLPRGAHQSVMLFCAGLAFVGACPIVNLLGVGGAVAEFFYLRRWVASTPHQSTYSGRDEYRSLLTNWGSIALAFSAIAVYLVIGRVLPIAEWCGR